MRLKIWTEFHYLYRDAGNFKVFGSVVLEGRLNEWARAAIVNSLDEDGRFVAEQVHVPTLYEPLYQHTGGPSTVDVCTHEFCHFEEVKSEHAPAGSEVWGSSVNFVAVFTRIREWAMELSPNAEKCRPTSPENLYARRIFHRDAALDADARPAGGV